MDKTYIQKMTEGFENELKKLAAPAPAGGGLGGILSTLAKKEVALPVAGMLAYHTLTTANRDRKLGRQMRMQSGGGY